MTADGGGRRLPVQALGLADQAVASGTNFVTIIILARALAPASFGYFVLAFTLLQSAGAIQSALITRPHNVLGAIRSGEDYVRYTTGTLALQAGYAALWALLFAVLAGITAVAGSPSALVFLAAVPAVLAWQLQELGRRVLYTERRLELALTGDVLSYGGQTAALLVLASAGELSGARALLVVAATSALALAAIAPGLRRSVGTSLDRDAMQANWQFGRWLGAAEVAYWCASQSYIYVGGLVVGPAASAVLKSAQTLLGPVSVFLAFFVNYLPTTFVRAGSAGRDALRRRMRVALLTTVPPALVYGLLVGAFAPQLLQLVYGDAYRPYATVVRLFAAYYVVLAVSDVFVAALAARGLTRQIFAGHLAGAVISLAAGWLLLERWGASGGAAGMIISMLAAFTLFVRAFAAGGRAGAEAFA